MEKEPRIRDIPTIIKPIQDFQNLKNAKEALPLIKPFLKQFGIEVDKIDLELAKVEALSRSAEELASIPDRFNDLFAERGWIIYELMNLEVAKAAINKAESGDIDGAETDLVNYYDDDTVRWNITNMKSVEAFSARWHLAQKALIDYREARYHACVPVVLALLDGIVNDAHEKGRGSKLGFFAENANLEAWNSISGHSKGLKALVGVFNKGRYKTISDQITIPYRNGILHGMDLGYDNKMVAAKAWAALFSVRDWAMKAEQGLLDPQPPEEPKPWSQVIKQISDNEAEKLKLQEWKPRVVRLGQNIPATGGPDDYEKWTPERTLAEFLSNWKKAKPDYRTMADCVLLSSRDNKNAMPARIRKIYNSKHLQSFEFTGIRDTAAARTVIQANLVYEEFGNQVGKTVEFIMINNSANGKPAVRGPGSSWFILFWDIV
jgi:hypothetical protein